MLVVVDQPATIGALTVAVVRDMGIPMGYLPDLSMWRIADLIPGNAKTNARDTTVIAQIGRTIPHTLWAVNGSDQNTAALFMLTGFDLDLVRQVNQTSNRIRGLYTQIHPTLGKVLGPRLKHDAVLEVIVSWSVPIVLWKAGRVRVAAELKAHGARRYEAWAGEIISALEVQNVVVIGVDAARTILPHLARQLIALHARHHNAVAKVKTLVETHPLHRILTSVSGIGVRAVAVFIIETLGRSFDAGAYLVSYTGLTPVTRRSGSSIRGEYTSHTGNKRLKWVVSLSTLTSLRSNPVSRAYYDRKIAQGKRHSQAVIALAHHRILTLHAMIRSATLYGPQPTHQLPTVVWYTT